MTKKKHILDLSNRSNMFYWQTNRRITLEDMKNIFMDRRKTVSLEDTKAAIEFGMKHTTSTFRDKNATVVKMSDPIPFGSVNNVIRAKLSNGKEVVVRMHPYGVRNGYFWSEKVASSSAKSKGVPAYETIYIDDSLKQFDFCFMLMEALPGKALQAFLPIDEGLDHKLMKQSGNFMAKFHEVKPDGFGYFDNEIAQRENRLQGIYQKFSEHIYAALEEDMRFLVDQKVLTSKQEKSVYSIFSAQSDLFSCDSPSLVHNDIADWNQLSDGKSISGMIDWDECFSGDPVMDFAQWSLFYDDQRLTYLIEGYQQVSPLPDAFWEKLHLFRLRYLVSKLHLRKKRALVVLDSKFLNERIQRGMEVLAQEFAYFKIK